MKQKVSRIVLTWVFAGSAGGKGRFEGWFVTALAVCVPPSRGPRPSLAVAELLELRAAGGLFITPGRADGSSQVPLSSCPLFCVAQWTPQNKKNIAFARKVKRTPLSREMASLNL